MRAEHEVNEILRKVVASEKLATLSGMSFKDGIELALQWVLEEVETGELLDE